ncbi:MAG: ABC transporter permease [Planctomycetaceae bacterium]|nr:ABC transporter permease [Planctomycetaceae bacterium]
MLSYIVRRLGIGLITLTLITFIIYGLIRNMPGSPVTQELSQLDPGKAISQEDYERILKSYGLDKPWYVAYGVWVKNVLQGDLGRSFSRKRPVTRLVMERVGPTLLLSVSSLLLTYLLSIPLGLIATARAGTIEERTGSTILYMLYSFPSFVAALFLQLQFAVRMGWLPLFGMVSDNYDSLSLFGKVSDVFWHSLLPVTCYTYGSLAYYSRFIRANMQEVIRQDYIRTARAKGLGPIRVLWHHAFRNTLIPLVTLIGLTLPTLLSGSIIIEQIFTWPGMGRLFFESIRERDYPTIMGLTLMFSVLTLAGQLLADVLYAVVDPRVRLEDK